MLLINGPFSMRLLYLANSRLPTEKAHGWQIIKTIEALQKQAWLEAGLFLALGGFVSLGGF